VTVIRVTTLNKREKLLELMYMTVCDLLSAIDKKEVNKQILILSDIREAIDAVDSVQPNDS
jgi:hypothetical protein